MKIIAILTFALVGFAVIVKVLAPIVVMPLLDALGR